MAPARGVGYTLGIIACANGALLVGLLALGWAPGTVAFLFWYESALIGAFTLAKLAASLRGYVPGPRNRVTYVRLPRPGDTTRASSTVPRVGRITVLPLFLVLYGGLLAVYGGMLLFALKERNPLQLVETALSSGGAQVAMALLAAEHLWAFWRQFAQGPAWMRSDPTFHFWKPFGLAIVMWLAFVLGFLLFGWLHSPLPVLVVLILLKAIAEAFGVLMDAQAGEWQRVDAPDD